jgi:nitroreductase
VAGAVNGAGHWPFYDSRKDIAVNAIATPEQIRHVVQAAGLAPSVHNTQPWRFVARPEHLELHADPSRQLRVLDPDGRQLHLSCGAALFHARVAARALGLDVQIRLLPDPLHPTHFANLVLTPGHPATGLEIRLATAILQRHTHRGAFDERPIPAAVLDVLRDAALAEGARLCEVVSEDQLVELEVLLSSADAMEERDAGYREELAQWVHDGPLRPDGIPATANGHAPGSSLRQRDFTLRDPAKLDGTAPAPDRPAVVVLTTDGDAPMAWLRAGQAVASMLLLAAAFGVQAQPLGQVTDVLAYRFGLRQALGLAGMPQLVLRMGFAPSRASTPRRSVDEVLVAVAD